MVDLRTIHEAIEQQNTVIDQLTQGVTMMNETLGVQSEMMERLLQAVSADEPAESPMMDAMIKIVAMLQDINSKLDRMERRAAASRYTISPEAAGTAD